jgi:radical SAM superfamily enzyme YgiQ (UPF0313 family)
MRITMASFAILTPYPGTALYRRLLAENRLTDPRWWLRDDHERGSPYFRPRKLTREQLHEGWVRAWGRFYEWRSMWRRFTLRPGSSWVQGLGYWPLNLLQRRMATGRIAGTAARAHAGSLPQPC